MKNYHSILGVSPSATKEEIKKAYRALALQHHPDRGGDENKFKEVTEAYEALTNPQPQQQASQHYSDLEDLFNSVFGGAHRNARTTKFNPDISTTIELTLGEIYSGTQKKITLNRTTTCYTCSGHGGTFVACTACAGSGFQMKKMHGITMRSNCTVCSGQGGRVPNPKSCAPCGGKGSQVETTSEDISFPPGAGNLNMPIQMTLAGRGNKYAPGQQGDLYITITAIPQTEFSQDGLNLVCTRKIKFSELCLGSKIEITMPDTKVVTIKIPPGTNINKFQRVPKKGMPQTLSTHKGDLLVELQLDLPVEFSTEQKEMLEALQKNGL